MMAVGINSPQGEIMSDGGIGRGFNKLAGHFRDPSKSKEKDTPPATPRTAKRVTFDPGSKGLTPRSVAASKPTDEGSNDVPSSLAQPAQHEQPPEDDSWLEEVLANLATEEAEAGNPDAQPTQTTSSAIDTLKHDRAPPPVRTTIIIQPDLEQVTESPLPTIGTRQVLPPTPSTTTTTTTTTV
ncbi:MAG TPA: hypothetical protein VHK03_00005, partial [Aestuariivirgaceae bacterium]|nr:hypothetical protein [Aestuariivirgaceae bacterium]